MLIVNINEQGTGYEYSMSIDLTKGALHLKEHPIVSKFAIGELLVQTQRHGGGTAVPSIHTKLSYVSDFKKCTMPLRLNQ